MARFLAGIAFAGLMAVSTQGLQAAEATTPQPQVCINTMQIDHTTVPDPRTILFYMRGGKIWKNALRNDCIGLKFYGFAYQATPPNQICGNMQTIRVLQIGSVCMLGAFTPYTPSKAKPAP